MADKGQQTSSDSGDFRWLGQGDVPAALNAWMNKIAADSKNDFTTGDRFWSVIGVKSVPRTELERVLL